MPHLQQRNGLERQTCPDSMTLAAFMENQLGASDRDAIAMHLTQCSACAELHDRLVGFSKATAAAQDPEWENTEKRLAIWMSGFLDAHASARRSADRAPAGNSAKERNWWRSVKFQWALSGVAVLALTAGAAFLLKPALSWHKEQPQIATQKNRAVETPTTPTATETSTEATAEKPATTEQVRPNAPAAGASKTPEVTAEARRNIRDSGYSGDFAASRPPATEQAVSASATPLAQLQPKHSQVAQADIAADRPTTHAAHPTISSATPAWHSSTSSPASRAPRRPRGGQWATFCRAGDAACCGNPVSFRHSARTDNSRIFAAG